MPDVNRPQVRHLEFLGNGSGRSVPLQRRAHDRVEVAGQRRRPGGHLALGVVALQQLFLEREERPVIGMMNELIVVERIHQRVGERHPDEPRGRQARAHRDAIREHDVDAQAIEDPAGVIRLMGAHGRRFVAVEQQFPRGDHVGRRRSLTNRIRLRLQVVDRQRVELIVRPLAGARWPHRMRVMVDGPDAGDLLSDLRVHGGRHLPGRRARDGDGHRD